MSPELRSPAPTFYLPALTGFLSCATGIAAARISSAHSRVEVLLAAFVVILAGILAFFLRSKFKALSQLLGIGALVSLGFLVLSSQENYFENSMLNRTTSIYSGEAIIYGKVLSTPETSSSLVLFFLQTDSIIVDSSLIRAREKIYAVVSGIQKADARFILKVGEKVKLYTELDHIEAAKIRMNFHPISD